MSETTTSVTAIRLELEEKLALHGERAYNAVNGPSGGKADDKH
jgi:hypothetical protein